MEIIDLFHLAPSKREGVEAEYRRLASSDSPCQSQMAQMMLQFIQRLRRGVIGPTLYAFKTADELSLQYHRGASTATIEAKVDYMDRSLLVDGVPRLHYRLAYTVHASDNIVVPKTELRTHDVDEAYRFVIDAIEACRNTG